MAQCVLACHYSKNQSKSYQQKNVHLFWEIFRHRVLCRVWCIFTIRSHSGARSERRDCPYQWLSNGKKKNNVHVWVYYNRGVETNKHFPGATRVTVSSAENLHHGHIRPPSPRKRKQVQLGGVGAGVSRRRLRSVRLECSGKQILKASGDGAAASPSTQKEIVKANARHFFPPVSLKRPALLHSHPKSARPVLNEPLS